jgi:dimethylhistidine N-methyltransferase
MSPRPASVVELGSGSAVTTRILLDALGGHAATYVPIDVSASALEASAHELAADYPSLSVVGVAGTYEDGLRRLRELAPAPRLVLWLGSNVGNYDRAAAAGFLAGVRRALAPGDRVLMGVELRKDAARLHAAYDDARGVTAAFNKNLLARINRELGGAFDLDDFAHRAVVLDGPGRVEMHLVARRAHTVRIAALDLDVAFAEGEHIHTEDSTKYSHEEIAALARAAGLAVLASWTDAGDGFADVLLGAAS